MCRKYDLVQSSSNLGWPLSHFVLGVKCLNFLLGFLVLCFSSFSSPC